MRLVVAVLLLAAPLALARNGGIESVSCTGCHAAGTHTTTVTLTPATFNPGETITVRVTARGTGSAGGVFLTSSGVGTFAVVAGQNTRLTNGSIVHSGPKGASGGQVTFDVRWTAPATMGGVDFEAATVLANGDGSRNGDSTGEARASAAFGCAPITYFRDLDGDGVGALSSGTTQNCMVPLGFSATDDDCDDFDNRRTPGKTEACNGLDDDCDGTVGEGLNAATTFPDADGDGYGAIAGAPMTGCAGGNRAPNNQDCDDTRAEVHPGATETCNERDDDCDSARDEGARVRCGVGWCQRLGPSCLAADCVPGLPVTERCNLLDDDCDGTVDDGNLCGDGASCTDGRCVEAGGVDAGTGRGPGGGSTCAVTPTWLVPVLAAAGLLRRRRR